MKNNSPAPSEDFETEIVRQKRLNLQRKRTRIIQAASQLQASSRTLKQHLASKLKQLQAFEDDHYAGDIAEQTLLSHDEMAIALQAVALVHSQFQLRSVKRQRKREGW